MAGRFAAGDLRTGRILVKNVPAVSGSATVVLNAAGTISCDLKLPMVDPYTDVTVPFINLIEPCRSFLAYIEDILDSFGLPTGTEKVINAGPIWTDSYDFDSKTLSLNAAGIASYWDYRYILPLLNDADPTDVPTGHDSTWTGLSLRTIAKRAVQQAVSWTGGSVPIIFEADFAGSNDRIYLGLELNRLGDKLKDLNNVIDGPDIQFRPQFKAGTDSTFIEWVMVTGNPEIRQSGADHIWDMTTAFPTIQGAKLDRDGTAYMTDAYGIGSTPTVATDGATADQTAPPLVTKSYDDTLIGLNFPRMEGKDSHASVSIPATLQGYTDNDVLVGRNAIASWSFNSKKSVSPSIGEISEGDYGKIKTKNDPRVPDGNHPVRIMQYTCTLGSDFVKYTCFPTRATS